MTRPGGLSPRRPGWCAFARASSSGSPSGRVSPRSVWLRPPSQPLSVQLGLPGKIVVSAEFLAVSGGRRQLWIREPAGSSPSPVPSRFRRGDEPGWSGLAPDRTVPGRRFSSLQTPPTGREVAGVEAERPELLGLPAPGTDLSIGTPGCDPAAGPYSNVEGTLELLRLPAFRLTGPMPVGVRVCCRGRLRFHWRRLCPRRRVVERDRSCDREGEAARLLSALLLPAISSAHNKSAQQVIYATAGDRIVLGRTGWTYFITATIPLEVPRQARPQGSAGLRATVRARARTSSRGRRRQRAPQHEGAATNGGGSRQHGDRRLHARAGHARCRLGWRLVSTAACARRTPALARRARGSGVPRLSLSVT